MAVTIQDKVALITGASRGIGRAAALALAAEGAHVVVTARTQSELESLADEIVTMGRRALVVAGDAANEDDVKRLHAETMAEFGHVDILVNNAGVGKYGPLGNLSVADYDWMMNTNMRTTFLVTHAFLGEMQARKQGNIVFIGSVAGLKGLPMEAVYCASKHAQYGFATALDAECREHNIKVSYIAPGGVHTYFAFGTGRTQGDPVLEEFLDSEDVAEAVVFAVMQPPKSRVFLIGMRPMREAL
ncbi:MAG: SDR family oxidoreductase [Pleurocapsa minor GSE-CHR-MK-17-07R]|jgi:3-oxoacyl-[acyl-carrier protein] reductase|nr:SDR family oxidoreductase [Pleurocapsa minor GSE-CHR-MK 17-07R]